MVVRDYILFELRPCLYHSHRLYPRKSKMGIASVFVLTASYFFLQQQCHWSLLFLWAFYKQ